MNERNPILLCKEIKVFYSLIQWLIVKIRQCCMVPSATVSHSIREKHFRYAICVEAEKIAYFLTSTHFVLA